MRILLVDDDRMAAAIISMALEQADYEVTVAASGEEALVIFGDDDGFCTIISDLNMPGIDGVELYQRLKAAGLQVPFILLSGDNPDHLRRRDPGISRYLVKDEALAETIIGEVAQLLTGTEK